MATCPEDCDNEETLDQLFEEASSTLEYKTCYYPAHEKLVVKEWLGKLKTTNTSLDEKRLRCDVTMYLLNLANQHQPFPMPFAETPKSETVAELVKTFPKDIPYSCPTELTRNNLVEMFKNSPDHGAFLASQPVPKSGTFCFYILRKATN